MVTLRQSDLQPPLMVSERWQRVTDMMLQGLEEDGYVAVQLMPNQAEALAAAYQKFYGKQGILKQPLDTRLEVCNANLDCGYSDLGHKQSFTYRAGRRWVPDVLSTFQHEAFSFDSIAARTGGCLWPVQGSNLHKFLYMLADAICELK